MKGALKTFFVYLSIFIGLCAVAFIACLLAMIFFHAHILGYKFVKYEEVYNVSYDVAENNITAIKVNTGSMSVNIKPSDDENIKVQCSGKISGFTGVNNEDWSYNHSYINYTFKESSVINKTLNIDIFEPSGWMFKDEYYINIYVPASAIAYLEVSTNAGDISYNGSTDIDMIGSQLYLSTEKGKVVVIEPDAQQMYLSTVNGECGISAKENIDSEVNIDTNSGKITIAKPLTKNLTISSNADRVGPSIYADRLLGDVTIISPYGQIFANSIGDESAPSDFVLSAKNFKVNVTNIYGKVYASAAGSNIIPGINVNVKYLISSASSTASVSYLSCGTGDVSIGYTDAPIVVATTSGNITISNLKQLVEGTVNISAGKNANVSINYNIDSMDSDNSKFIATIKNGSMNVNNIKYLTTIIADDAGNNSTINLSFVEVKGHLSSINEAYNNIKSNGHKLNVKINNSKSYRIVLDQPDKTVYKMGENSVLGLIQTTKIIEGSSDYLNKVDGKYKYQARVNYSEQDYDKVGSIIITSTTGTVTVDGFVPSGR